MAAFECGLERGELSLPEEVEGLWKEASALSRSGRYIEAIDAYSRCVPILDAHKHKQGIATCFNAMLFMARQQEPLLAKRLLQKVLSSAQDFGDRLILAMCYIDLATIAYDLREFEESVDTYRWATEICQEVGEREMLAKCCMQMGIIYGNIAVSTSQRGKYDKGLTWFRRCLKVYTSTGSMIDIGRCYFQMALTAFENGRFRDSMKFYKQRFRIYKKLGDKHGQATTCECMAMVASKLENTRLVWKYLNKARTLHEAIGSHLNPGLREKLGL